MTETDKTTLALALLWIWGFSIASLLRWWSNRLHAWLKSKGKSQKKNKKQKQKKQPA